ncbi:hypothetical protein KM043_008700 [Ampulex compressa]|nr:hypothetical protein KM043_008700 [Ampulex compressa]
MERRKRSEDGTERTPSPHVSPRLSPALSPFRASTLLRGRACTASKERADRVAPRANITRPPSARHDLRTKDSCATGASVPKTSNKCSIRARLRKSPGHPEQPSRVSRRTETGLAERLWNPTDEGARDAAVLGPPAVSRIVAFLHLPTG